ncbi:hypothetical protein DPMN_138119 [Dreissena polymorpha]|uniref:Uncharacterized protein n=1 Tax=Dreissena polymorpha TaxID=45954 RepID=A0A9D4G3X1_DREPO|nr:hypothetical protein DPMN_138119 [Dreissena polymorpha]
MAEHFDAEDVHRADGDRGGVIRLAFAGYTGNNAQAVVNNNIVTVTAQQGEDTRIAELDFQGHIIEGNPVVQNRLGFVDVTVRVNVNLNDWMARRNAGQ